MGFGFARVRIKGIRISEGLLYNNVCMYDSIHIYLLRLVLSGVVVVCGECYNLG